MAFSKEVKDRIIFVQPPEERFNCPICLCVLTTPYQTECCGNHLCNPCASSVKKTSKKCPICQTTPLNGMVDKNFMRQLYELKVYCIYQEKGCKWVGDYGKIERHLELGKEKGECQFVVVKCPLSVCCEERILRKVLTDHLDNVCRYRQTSCRFCGFLSTVQVVTTTHVNECKYYPISCPNQCSNGTYPRCQLNDHIAKCPDQEVACTFSEMGCKEKIKRRLLQKHLEDKTTLHQKIMCRTITEQMSKLKSQNTIIEALQKDKNELESKIRHLTQEVVSLKQQSCEDQWVNGLRSVTKKMMRSNWPLYLSNMVELTAIEPIVPVIFKVPFTINKEGCNGLCVNSTYGYYGNQHNHYSAPIYQSSPFYSHHDGYKLYLTAKLVCHCPCCTQEEVDSEEEKFEDVCIRTFNPYVQQTYDSKPHENEEILNLSVSLSTAKSEHSRRLKWPFQKCITLNVLNDENDDDHHSITKEFTGASEGLQLEIVPLKPKPYQIRGRRPGYARMGYGGMGRPRSPVSDEGLELETVSLEPKSYQIQGMGRRRGLGYGFGGKGRRSSPVSESTVISQPSQSAIFSDSWFGSHAANFDAGNVKKEDTLKSGQDKYIFKNPNCILFPFDADKCAYGIHTDEQNYEYECHVYLKITF